MTRLLVRALACALLLECSAGACASGLESAHEAYLGGDFYRAIERYERAGASARSSAATLELARGYWMTKQPERAQALAEGVLSKEPRNSDALLLLGDVFAERGDWKAAAQRFVQASAGDSPRPEIWLRLGQALQMDGNPIAAEVAFRAYRQFQGN